MKKSIAKKWIKALRSGQYDQGTGRLVNTTDDGHEYFCCLGVLCNIATEQGYGQWRGLAFVDEAKESANVFLTKGVMKWAGMATTYGCCPGAKLGLDVLNDQGKTFAEIADIIEQNWEAL